jgi:hypothetical protein
MKVYLKGRLASRIGGWLCATGKQRAAPTNLSGIWKLSLTESDFGKAQAPVSIDVAVEHHEPSVRYFGIFVDPEGTPAFFDVEATFDGKARSSGGITILSKRIDAFTTCTEWKSRDGKRLETTTMRVSRNGRVLAVDRRMVGPKGDIQWSEVYERQLAPDVVLDRAESRPWNLWRPNLLDLDPLNGVASAMHAASEKVSD